MKINNPPPIVRISIGHFQPKQVAVVIKNYPNRRLCFGQLSEKLEGNLAYYVGIDKEKFSITNVSLWATLENAQQMDRLKEMQDLRKEFQELNIEFAPNNES